jgi:hypothetical protein
MKYIYRVKFSMKYEGDDWIEDVVNVLANDDAQKAIEKAASDVLGRKFKDTENSGKIIKCVGFRLSEVHILASAEL